MSSFRRLSVGAALLVVSALSPAVALVCDEGGVFDATSTLRRDGTAELEVRFPPHMLGFQTRLKDLLGDVPFEVSKERGGLVWVVSMSFDSVDAIAALPMMEEYEIGIPTLRDREGVKVLRVPAFAIKKRAVRMRLAGADDDRIMLCWILEAPGKILESNAQTIERRSAKWKLTLGEFWKLADPAFEAVIEAGPTFSAAKSP